MSGEQAAWSKKICLISSGNLASSPRLVKEAVTLRDRGYAVRIVATDIIGSLSGFDAELAAKIGCEVKIVRYGRPFWKRFVRRIRQRAAREVAERTGGVTVRLAVLAHHPLTLSLTEYASVKPADLYIAHNLAALSAAAVAAKRHSGKLGFDAEDYHCGELAPTPENRLELAIRRALEGHFLPQCAHLTAASPLIAEPYQKDYGVMMTPILNVFPLSEAPCEPAEPSSRRGRLPSLYWFSQTIGPGRGLEEIVKTMG
jgi:hypothetical protein